MHSPRIPRLRKPFPPENDPRPPDDGSHADSRPLIHAREFPRFRDSRAWTAYAGERIAPLFPVTIRGVQTGNAVRTKKKQRRKPFFEGGQICWSSFASGTAAATRRGKTKTHPPEASRTPDCSEAGRTRRRKNRTRNESPDAAGKPASISRRLARTGRGSESRYSVQLISA